MAYLVYNKFGTVVACEIRDAQEAKFAVKVHHPEGGFFRYDEPEEVENYWYPQGVKTPLREFHLGNYRSNITIGETLSIADIPEGTEIILRLTPIGKVGPVGIMKWTPKVKGLYDFTFRKLGYKTDEIRIVVGIKPKFRKAFDLELS